ncbi:hypothetical protein BC351_00470 [Paenibacillus ferrarius]|uniref:GIY-YIG domain-containing protein n=1 Tax=Paenibacillus ferrarius TaxID=1469647 RepID=A0A1V4HS56_9BACL|nr:tyrosine-type recombinase/integrase [Paenibacillus ferrarius]OPH61750.1 hypothetical protein BC351_00470 [Paenibacillus ferrarius]
MVELEGKRRVRENKKDNVTYYIYRFINKNGEVIYVGKTVQPIKNRMGVHFGFSGHLKLECYEQKESIEYITLKSRIDMNIKEMYYIGKWKPVFNSDYNKLYHEEMTIKINEDDNWIILNEDIEKFNENKKKKPINHLTLEDIKKFVDSIDVNTLTGKRDKAILLLSFSLGLRISELTSINVEDIEITDKELIIKIFNNTKNAYISKIVMYSHNEYCTIVALQDWIKNSKIKSDSLFRSIKKSDLVFTRLSSQSVTDIVKKYSTLAGFDPTLYSGDSLKSGYVKSNL